MAVQKRNIEIIKLLLAHEKLDPNILNILNLAFHAILNSKSLYYLSYN